MERIYDIRQAATTALYNEHPEWATWESAKRLLCVEAHDWIDKTSNQLIMDCYQSDDNIEIALRLCLCLKSPIDHQRTRIVTLEDTWAWGIDEKTIWALAIRGPIHVESVFDEQRKAYHQIRTVFWSEFPFNEMQSLTQEELYDYPYRNRFRFDEWMAGMKEPILPIKPEHAANSVKANLHNTSPSVRNTSPSIVPGNPAPATTPSKQKEGCYIATAVYGSYNAPEVLVLRRFRDETLQKTALGRWFIRTYYRWSPAIAEKLRNAKRLNRMVRKILDRWVARLDTKTRK